MARPDESTLTWDTATDVPRADIPTRKKARRRARLLRAAIWASVVLLPFALLAVVVSAGSSSSVDPSGEDGGARSSAGRVAATASLRAWLDAEPSPLPRASIISWDGASIVSVVEPEENSAAGTPTVTTEIDHFTLGIAPVEPEEPADTTTTVTASPRPSTTTKPSASTTSTTTEPAATTTSTTTKPEVEVGDSPWVYTVTADVLVAVDGRGGAVVLSRPSLIAEADAAVDEWRPDIAEAGWPETVPVTSTEDIDGAVRRWAIAYTSGDPEELRLAVGDPIPGRYYAPLVGATVTDVSILAAATTEVENDAEPTSVIVRAEVTLDWSTDGSAGDGIDGTTDPDDDSDGSSTTDSTTTTTDPDDDSDATIEADDEDVLAAPPMTFDLLVTGANTASPGVVAWGGAGSGTTLKPYDNASTGERQRAVDPNDPLDPAYTTEEDGDAATTTTTEDGGG